MRYLHSMVRVRDLEASLKFYCDVFGMIEVRRIDNQAGKFTLVFLAARQDVDRARTSEACELELTHNWGSTEDYGSARNFGHLAYEVDDIYATCQSLMDKGIVINRPPRDGRMAFIRSPDLVSIELLQKGDPLAPQEPWTSMANTGVW